jgi:ferrous iron transport protein A
MLPLNVAAPGEENIIRKISGSPEVKRHLEDLGFVVGGSVTLISALNGNLIVNVKGTRVALDAELARRIMV